MTWQTQLKETAVALGLKGADLVQKCSRKELTDICNGIGPSWFPETLRSIITGLNPTLRIVADLHDLMYYFADGSDQQFEEANRAFAENGAILAKHTYSWYDPRRYAVILKARRFATICQQFGRLAYDKAIEDRKSKEMEGEKDA